MSFEIVAEGEDEDVEREWKRGAGLEGTCRAQCAERGAELGVL
jgi:hypothetical protein